MAYGIPYLIGGLGLALGYAWAACRRMRRPVSAELMAFHRREQMLKLRAIVASVLRLKRLDRFTVLPAVIVLVYLISIFALARRWSTLNHQAA